MAARCRPPAAPLRRCGFALMGVADRLAASLAATLYRCSLLTLPAYTPIRLPAPQATASATATATVNATVTVLTTGNASGCGTATAASTAVADAQAQVRHPAAAGILQCQPLLQLASEATALFPLLPPAGRQHRHRRSLLLLCRCPGNRQR